jgi:hypothetical protein
VAFARTTIVNTPDRDAARRWAAEMPAIISRTGPTPLAFPLSGGNSVFSVAVKGAVPAVWQVSATNPHIGGSTG